MNRKNLIFALMLLLPMLATGQSSKQQKKEVQKQTKELTKEGWHVNPDAMSLEEQLERSYIFHSKLDENNRRVYFTATSVEQAQNYALARSKAITLAIGDLADKLVDEDQMNGVMNSTAAAWHTDWYRIIIQQTTSNINSITPDDSQIQIDYLQPSVTPALGELKVVIDMYRVLPNGLIEVQIVMAATKQELTDYFNQYASNRNKKTTLTTFINIR